MTARPEGGEPFFPPADHDHRSCVADALDAADSLCARRGARLTPLRRRVLEIVREGHAPQGAYDILARLREDGRRADPPTVYRALDFLLEQGLVHRIESLNAFVGCAHPAARHAAQFLICQDCGTVAELDDPEIARLIAAKARAAGFRGEATTVEVRGTCPSCAGGAPAR